MNFKQYVLRLLIAALCIAPSHVRSFADENSEVESRLRASVEVLASDQLEGRGTGTPGLDQAADYIAGEFSKLGLKTDLFNGSPFQTFEVITETKIGPQENNRITLQWPASADGASTAKQLKLGEDFNTLSLGGTHQAQAAVVFAGYGITAPEFKYDDYAGIDVKGKLIVLLRKEPQQQNEKSVFGGTNNTRHAEFQTKISNAYQHGAAGVILVNDAFGIADERIARRKQWTETLDKLEQERAAFRGKANPTEEDWTKHREAVGKLAERISVLNAQLAGDGDELIAPDAAGFTTGTRKMSVYFAKRAVIDPMIQAGMGVDLAALESQIDSDLTPRSRELSGFLADFESSLEHVRANAKNVIAVREGSGPLADQTIIVGAHYDHLGMGGRGAGSLAPWTRAIHNGADDNASGAAGLIEIARRLTQTPAESSRRIVFAAFSAEERGLLGSKHYVDNPPFPLERTAAMVNLDMIGRLNDNQLIVYGTGTSANFDSLIETLNKKYSFNLKKDPSGDGPSDHQTFNTKNIPVFHFFTGSHSDYHRPSDDIEKINVAGMRRITDMTVELVEHLAKVEERPNFIAVKSKAVIHSNERPRPSLGTMPDYGANVEGCRLELVREDGPADRAGLKAGDIITMLGENKVGSVEDYDGALRKFRPGDTIKITLERDGKPMVVEATLGEPRM